MVSYSAAPVMGELGASPEEYSGVATMYAAIAIIVIAKHAGSSSARAGALS